MPTRLKGKFYWTAIRLAMTYGEDCWSIKKQHMHKMNVAKMGMLRWMCDKTRKNKIKNERFREHLGVSTIGDKIRKTRLRWFEHVQCRPTMTPVRKSLAMKVDGPPRERGRPKKDVDGCSKNRYEKCNLSEDLFQDRSERRNKIRIADPNIVGGIRLR